MNTEDHLPLVAIIGSPNVGKSSLFNRIIRHRQAITSKLPHTTLDPVFASLKWKTKTFRLVDTAGLFNSKAKDPLLSEAVQQTKEILPIADLIILVVDRTIALSDSDRLAAKSILKANKPAILAVNKSDKLKSRQPDSIYLGLGLKDLIFVSATTGQGIPELLNKVVKLIPQIKISSTSQQAIKVAIIGPVNAGKSTLINRLSKRKISLVSPIPGTTRDVSATSLNLAEQNIIFFDTAGLKKKSRQLTEITYYSSIRTLEAILKSDICLLVIDGLKLATRQDQRIAKMVITCGKGLIIAVNKSDLIEAELNRKEIQNYLGRKFRFCSWAPMVFISGLTGKNIRQLVKLIIKVSEARKTKITTSTLNKLILKSIYQSKLPKLGRRRLKINYLTQTGINPPEFSLFGTKLNNLHFSDQRHLENIIRKSFDFTGTPIKLIFKEKN